MSSPVMSSKSLLFGLCAVPFVGATMWFAIPADAAAEKGGCCEVVEPAPVDPEAELRRALVQIPNRVLLDQDGNEVRLYSDLIQGKKVIIDFIFTTCTSVCPTLQTVFEGVQTELGDRLGEDVILISVSVDPGTDTPERMKAFATDYNAKPGWYFLTGEVDDINEVLRAFGVWTKVKEEHSAMFVLGHEPTGKWMYQSGFVDPRSVVKQLENLCASD